MRKGTGGSGGAEVAGEILGDAPTFGGDFYCFALGVVEVKKHLTGAGSDAASYGRPGGWAGMLGGELDFGFERLDDISDGGRAGDDGMLVLEASEEPVAIHVGVKRNDLGAFELDGDAGEDLAEVGGEGRGGAGGGEEGIDLPGAGLG
ncbi:MAG: hypothetical protein M3Y27_22235 [Acidobacteriota bacterium]|nr:hypothetical protein [Acidobacteriota bacterium]